MREFDRPIGRVWRRLRFQRFLGALVWCLAAGFALTACAILVEKLARVPLPGPVWFPFALAGALGVGLAGVIALASGPKQLDAAIAIDRAFHLHERLSTALSLSPELRATPAGRALMADAIRHVEALDLGTHFGPRLPRAAWVPIVPGLIAVGLLFLPEWTGAQPKAVAKANSPTDQALIAKQAQALSRSLAQDRKNLDKSDLNETDKLLAELEKAADALSKAPPEAKDKALVELNKLTNALKDREKQLGSAEQINKQLQQLKDLAAAGPADDFAKDLARGDFEKAAEQVKKLQQKLANGEMNDAEKKALEQQIGEMKEQLEKLANLAERKKQLEAARKNGALTEQQFQEQMKKLEQQAQNLQQLQKLAKQLGQCQQAMQQGDMNKAASALGMTRQQLEDLARQAQELDSLDAALADLQECKEGISGDGLNQLGEDLKGLNKLGKRIRPGFGMKRGRGQGERPEAPDDVAYHGTKAPQQYGKGKAVITGFGPPKGTTKGESQIEVQEEIESAGAAAAEALTNQRVPSNVKKHILGYFDQVRKGD